MTLINEPTKDPHEPPTESVVEVDPSSIPDVAAKAKTIDKTLLELGQFHLEGREGAAERRAILNEIFRSVVTRVEEARSTGAAFESPPKDGGFSTEIFLKDEDRGAYRIYFDKPENGKKWGSMSVSHYGISPETGQIGRDDLSLYCSYDYSEHYYDEHPEWTTPDSTVEFEPGGHPQTLTTKTGPELAELIATLPILDRNGPELAEQRAFHEKYSYGLK